MSVNAQLKSAHPDQPWMWNVGWANRSIPDSGAKLQLILFVGLAIVWNIVGTPAGVLAVSEGIVKHRPVLWIALAFPIVGLGLIVKVIHLVLQGLRFGKSVFRLETLPAVAGSALAGTICVSRPVGTSRGVRLRLRCMKQDTVRTGHGGEAIQMAVWEKEQMLGHLPASAGGTEIPVYFEIPGNVPTCEENKGRSQHYWQLEVSADSKQSDYHAGFEVPVYSAAVAALPKTPVVDRAEPYREVEAEVREAQDKRISFIPLAGGGCEIHYRAGRNIGLGIAATAFGLTWAAGGLFFAWSNSPFELASLVVALFAGLVALISAIFAVRVWFLSKTVVANRDGITVIGSILGFQSSRFIAAGDVRGIIAKITSQDAKSGDTYYLIMVGNPIGNRVAASNLIKGQRDADWIADEMKKALNEDKIPV